jgi:prepilin-type N-terminal cleavage/methylation domain-containing protein
LTLIRRAKTLGGFTLLEVTITLVILSVSLLALAGLMVTTAQNNASGEHVTEAVTFGQDKLEECRATAWESLLPTTAGPGTDQRQGSTGVNYIRAWDIAQNGNFKTITVAVNWNDRINHSIKLVSVAAR